MAPLKEINPSAATTWLCVFLCPAEFFFWHRPGVFYHIASGRVCARMCVCACVCAFLDLNCRKLLPARADVRDGFSRVAAKSQLSFQGL